MDFSSWGLPLEPARGGCGKGARPLPVARRPHPVVRGRCGVASDRDAAGARRAPDSGGRSHLQVRRDSHPRLRWWPTEVGWETAGARSEPSRDCRRPDGFCRYHRHRARAATGDGAGFGGGGRRGEDRVAAPATAPAGCHSLSSRGCGDTRGTRPIGTGYSRSPRPGWSATSASPVERSVGSVRVANTAGGCRVRRIIGQPRRELVRIRGDDVLTYS